MNEVYRLVGRDRARLVDQFTEGLFSQALEIRLAGNEEGPALIADIRESPCPIFSIWGILVRDQRFRAREGLGIGSTLKELRRYYAIEVLTGEGGQFALATALELSFRLDASAAATDSSKVTAVWVAPQPLEVRKKRCPDQRPLGKAR